jgi:hypothetical protein
MHTMLHNGPRAAGILSCLLGLGLTGCFLPVPTVPLNLPAHGHTYKVRDRDNLPAVGAGILIVHTYYNNGMERLDCYPIRNGRAVVPFTLDMRVMPVEMFGYMFGYFSWVVPTYYLFFVNADHAHVYPVMPNLTYWEDSCYPKISEDRFIYGIEPRPEVLRMYPSNPYMERDMLLVIEQEVQKYFAVAERSRKDGWEPREDLHNEQQAKLIVKYIHSRLEALESGPASQPASAPAPPPASQP